MKNVTITLDEALAIRARVEAAGRGKSLSKFVGELIEREIGRDDDIDLNTIRQFLFGPGYPGISKNWRGREALYAEREDQLLRRYKSSGLRDRSQRPRKKSSGQRPVGAADRKPNARSKRSKPK
jgi:hypothetical protein